MSDTLAAERTSALPVLVSESAPDHLPATIPPASAAPQPRLSSITSAIAAVMQDIGAVAKRGNNEFHRYAYARMQDVLQTLTPLLAKHGIIIIQTETSRELFDNEAVVCMTYQFTIAHANGEVWPDRPVQTGISAARNTKGGFDDKAVNKCHTAARKYFLMGLFQIPTEDADDADQQKDRPRASPSRPAPSKIVTPQRNTPHDPETGEIGPHRLAAPTRPGGKVNWIAFGMDMMAAVNSAAAYEEVDQWIDLNRPHLDALKEEAPPVYDRLSKAVGNVRVRLFAPQPKDEPVPEPTGEPAERPGASAKGMTPADPQTAPGGLPGPSGAASGFKQPAVHTDIQDGPRASDAVRGPVSGQGSTLLHRPSPQVEPAGGVVTAGPVAQQAERSAFNREVADSTSAGTTSPLAGAADITGGAPVNSTGATIETQTAPDGHGMAASGASGAGVGSHPASAPTIPDQPMSAADLAADFHEKLSMGITVKAISSTYVTMYKDRIEALPIEDRKDFNPIYHAHNKRVTEGWDIEECRAICDAAIERIRTRHEHVGDLLGGIA